MEKFLKQNTGKLVGWIGLLGALTCFFGTTGLGVGFVLLLIIQVFGW